MTKLSTDIPPCDSGQRLQALEFGGLSIQRLSSRPFEDCTLVRYSVQYQGKSVRRRVASDCDSWPLSGFRLNAC